MNRNHSLAFVAAAVVCILLMARINSISAAGGEPEIVSAEAADRPESESWVPVGVARRGSHPHMNNLVFGRRSAATGSRLARPEAIERACRSVVDSCNKWRLAAEEWE